jgi:uncharacterized membrane protein
MSETLYTIIAFLISSILAVLVPVNSGWQTIIFCIIIVALLWNDDKILKKLKKKK